MVERQLRQRGIRDERVLTAMSRVPRHEFGPPEWKQEAYSDFPLPIGEGQTISQPYIVALMTEALCLTGEERVLELGTGSGYQAAILSDLGDELWTIESSAALRRAAEARLRRLGYDAIRCLEGDGTLGLPSQAPFDRILATGSLPTVPERLLDQLKPNGVFVGPIGRRNEQSLLRITYHPSGSEEEDLGLCRFVPLIGSNGWQDGGFGARGHR